MEAASAGLETKRNQSIARQIFLSSRVLGKLLLQKTSFEGLQLNTMHAAILPAIDLTGTRLTEIARRAGMTKQALSPYIQELEAADLLTRIEDPKDKRANLLLFTARGRSLLEKIYQSFAETEQAARTALGAEGYRNVRDGLELITQTFQRHSGGDVNPVQTLPPTPADLFASAFTHAAIGMALVGLDGRWLDVNDSLCRIAGYAKTELLGLTFQSITYPDDLQMDLSLLQQLMQGFIPSYHLEKRYIKKDGSIVWVHLTCTLVRHSDGIPYHFIAQVQDITERKRREENEKLFFEICPDMLAIANASGKLARLNGKWTTALGWSTEELAARPFMEFVHPEDRARTMTEAQATYSGRPMTGFINRYRHKDGSYRTLEWHTTVSTTGQLYCLVRDITGLRDATCIQTAQIN